MVGGDKRSVVYANLRTRPYYDRRCKNKINLSNNLLTNIDSLPDELVFRILLELDAQSIYESALFVCRKWYHMIHTHDFAHAHLHHSSPGLLFGNWNKDSPTFLTLRGGKIETFKLRSVFPDKYWSTWNGLTLGNNKEAKYNIFIVNFATKQHFALPLCPHQGGRVTWTSGIGHAPASMEYKVVWSNVRDGCAIFTVGVDTSWRYIGARDIFRTDSRILNHFPLTIEGIVYWTVEEGTSFWSLNLESEIFTEIYLPQGYESRKIRKHYLSTWSSLTLLVESSSSGFSWDVWELKKPETGGEWKKLPNIDLESQKCRVEQLPYREDCPSNNNPSLRPVGWLNHGEVLVLSVTRPTKVCLLYNVVTQQTDFIELDHYIGACWFFSYKNSLVRLDGCS